MLFLTHVFFLFTTGQYFFPAIYYLIKKEEKNLKKIFNASIVFDFISNYTNYIHMFITCPLFPLWLALGLFLTHVFFSLPQEEEKNLKKIFNASIVFDFISNYTNYIQDIFLQLISLLGDLKCS